MMCWLRTYSLLTLLFLSHNAVSQSHQSHLPVVSISVGSDIPDEPKVSATMGIMSNGTPNSSAGPFDQYDGDIGIELRGNSSLDFPKKSYTVQLRDTQGQAQGVDILGMGSDSDWVLHAMYIDKTLLRIPMSFYLFGEMGQYANDWQFVDLVINGNYHGVYLLVEKIKQGPSRVEISTIDSIDQTGGYILRIDWLEKAGDIKSEYESMSGQKLSLQHHYPKGSTLSSAQKSYLKNSVNRFESALFSDGFVNAAGERYDKWADIDAFASVFLINELSKNSDGYKLSSFIHKDNDQIDPRWKAGPIWDFDQTYGVSAVCSNSDPCGWLYLQNQERCEDLFSMPMWWDAMAGDSVFCNRLVSKWNHLRNTVLHIDSILNWIDGQVNYLDTAIDRNFLTWPILNESVWIDAYEPPGSYSAEIEIMKSWLLKRIEWIDQNLPFLYNYASQKSRVQVYPNPATEQVRVNAIPGASLRICDMAGREMYRSGQCQTAWQFNVQGWQTGVYIVYVVTSQGTFSGKFVVD